jgi:hypothetical protein
MLVLCLVSPARPDIAAGQTAPNFELQDLVGHHRSLSDWSGRPVVLCFFCGCRWCHDTARSWAILQRRRAQTLPRSIQPIHTVIVYSGGGVEARQFEKQTGLDQKNTTVLLDPELSVSATVYTAVPCPRVFVVRGNETVVYTNDHQDDAPRTVGGAVLAQKIAQAVAAIASVPITKPIEASQLEADDRPPHAHLTPIAGGPSETIDPDTHLVTCDFGTISQAQTKTIDHTFNLRNGTKWPILIDNVQPSCECTTAFVDNGIPCPLTVAPGKSVSITVYIDLTQLYPMAVDKTVMIFTTNQLAPLATLEMTGKLQN